MCDENTNQGTDNKSLSYWWLLGLAIAVILVQLGLWYLLICSFGTETDPWAVRGQFGDMFGAVNTLFSGLAFAGVIFAIILQSRELSLQRKELALSRTVNKAAAKAQKEQANLLEKASKIKVYEKEIDIELAMMNLDFANARAIGGSTKRKESVSRFSEKLPGIERRLFLDIWEMKKLAGIETEPSEPPTPQP